MTIREFKKYLINEISRLKIKRCGYKIRMTDKRIPNKDQLEAAYIYEVINTKIIQYTQLVSYINAVINKIDRTTAKMITAIAMIEDELHI